MNFDPLGLEVIGTWGVEPSLHSGSISTGPEGFSRSNGSIYLNVEVSGSGTFTFLAKCEDTCTDEDWTEDFSVDVTASYVGNAKIPGMCGAIAYATRYAGKMGGSLGRMRLGGRVSLVCAGVMFINTVKIAKAARKEVDKFIDKHTLGLINHYSNLGATAICKKSRL